MLQFKSLLESSCSLWINISTLRLTPCTLSEEHAAGSVAIHSILNLLLHKLINGDISMLNLCSTRSLGRGTVKLK